MSNQSQAGALDRGHQVGCPGLRDPSSQACGCAPVIPYAPMREDSAKLYQNIASFRQVLEMYPNLPADLLREMLEKTLTAAELLVQGIDRLQDVVEFIDKRRNA